MPIRASERWKYPADWPQISKRIRFDRAKGRCECEGECGRTHSHRCSREHGQFVIGAAGKQIKIVLTVMHLDHDPRNCDDANLLAACQACHLRYDMKHHQKNAAETRRSRKADGDLFP